MNLDEAEAEYDLKHGHCRREIARHKADNQEIMGINNSLRETLLAIKALCAGDRTPNWKDDWATTQTRGRIMDLVDNVVR